MQSKRVLFAPIATPNPSGIHKFELQKVLPIDKCDNKVLDFQNQIGKIGMIQPNPVFKVF
tara:strand:+ start:1277 stop:1456 length:180 start_codon:yes stop_codon:yes gene_type:complete